MASSRWQRYVRVFHLSYRALILTLFLSTPDYLPVYFQASLGVSAIRSSVYGFALALTIPPFGILTGLSVQIINRYRPQNYIGWMFIIVGFGVLSTLDEHSSRAAYIGSQIPLAVGLGMVWISTQFPILAPLPFSNSAHALSFFTFMRCFAQVRQSQPHQLFASHANAGSV